MSQDNRITKNMPLTIRSQGKKIMVLNKIEELRKKVFFQEAEINDLRACIKCEKIPEGYDVNDDATTELAVELAKSQLETSCMVEDAIHKADLLRVATKALEDIRAIATDAQKKIEEMNRARRKTS